MANGIALIQNTDLKDLYDSLNQLYNALIKSLDGISNNAEAQAVFNESGEVLHRIDLVQRLLFTKASGKISAAVAEVINANAKAVASLAEIAKITEAVKTVTQILTLVDKAIDLAKMVALA